jgi:predicted ATPase
MREAMAKHDEIVQGAIDRNGGNTVESGRAGDSIFAVFRAAKDAATCALEIQRGFRATAFPGGLRLRIRIALHTGEVELRSGHYFGPPLNRCARALALCHAGQTLLTYATRELLVEDPPADVELTDLGLYRLKDLRRSERLYQLTDVRDPEAFPPLSSKAAYRSNLPVLLTSFVGRERELVELRELQRRSRLLTLTGPGGAGKTRLAEQLAREVAPQLPGGAWLVELAPLSDSTLVAQTIATALDVDEQQGRTLMETLVERCSGAAMLLVLDNCEHMLDECARAAETLLTGCPDLRVVATSREALNIGGEVTWPVPSLARDEAVRLFRERAGARAPRVDLGDASTADIEAISERLDRIPLAIELAAARVASLPLDDIRRRLEEGIGLLTGGSRTATSRQSTLESAIDWSYDLLSEHERIVLRTVSVFAGRFALAGCEAVCAEFVPVSAVVDHIGQLVAKSLVVAVDGRYACLETIRAYARAKLATTGQADAARRAHAMYFLRLAESRGPGALGPWLDRMELEHPDLREAIAWSTAADPFVAARLATALYDFWLVRGYALEARELLERVANALRAAALERARALLECGVFAYTAGDISGASRVIENGVAEARTNGDTDLIARGLVIQGNVALAAGDLATAQNALDEGLALARAIPSGRREAEALHHLGSLALARGDAHLALSRFSESLERRHALGLVDETATTLMLRSFVQLVLSDTRAARADIMEALALSQAVRDRRAAWSLDVLSCLEALEGDAACAVRLAGAADTAFQTTGEKPPGVWRQLLRPMIQQAHAALGESASRSAWDEGRALDFDAALNYALTEISPSLRGGQPSF